MRYIGMAFIKRRLPHRENHGHNFCLVVAWAFPPNFLFLPSTGTSLEQSQ